MRPGHKSHNDQCEEAVMWRCRGDTAEQKVRQIRQGDLITCQKCDAKEIFTPQMLSPSQHSKSSHFEKPVLCFGPFLFLVSPICRECCVLLTEPFSHRSFDLVRSLSLVNEQSRPHCGGTGRIDLANAQADFLRLFLAKSGMS
jgi:hypothetical protein